MSALRILHVYRTYFPDTQGGLEEVVRTLALGARQQGFEVVVLYPSKRVQQTEETVVDSVRVCRVPELFELASCNVFVRGIGAFRRWAAWADLIHYHFPWPFADVLHGAVAARLGRRTVITYHSDVVRQARLGKLYAPLMWRFLNSADVVVSTSENYARSSQVLQRLRVPQRVIPIGLDRARLPAPEAERVASWRERVGEGFFFFVGVLRYYKGLDVLLRAVAGTALRVVIAGDGPERGRLGALAGELRLDNVTFTGRVADADKCALFSLARAFVLPSNRRSEAFGVALLEAMHFGLPLVTAEIGTGTSFVNAAGQTGMCVPPDDPAALRLAMEGLAKDDALRDRMGAAARLRLHGFFEAQQMVDAYCALYRELCPPTGAPTRML